MGAVCGGFFFFLIVILLSSSPTPLSFSLCLLESFVSLFVLLFLDSSFIPLESFVVTITFHCGNSVGLAFSGFSDVVMYISVC